MTKYSDDTKGSRWAAENRRKASLLTDKQREGLFNRAICRIYRGILKTILLLFLCLPAQAAQIVTATIIVTNAPASDGNTLTVNGSTRTWRTSVTAPSTEIAISASIGGSATNLYNQVAAFPFSTMTLSRSGTNAIVLRGIVDQAVSASIVGTWGSAVLSTQTVTSLQVVRVPVSSEPVALARTNIPSLLVTAFSTLAQNSLSQTSTAMAEVVGLTNTQTMSGKKIWTGSNVFLVPVLSNAVNYGVAFTSPGSGSGSEEFGNGAAATGTDSLAVGRDAGATAVDTTAVGKLASASSLGATALGREASATGTNSTSLGALAIADGAFSVALGNGASVGAGHTNSMAIGTSVATTTFNQVRVGGSGHTVSVPGILSPAVTTNSTYYGTIGLLSSGITSATTHTNSTITGATTDNSTHVFNSTIRRTRLTHTALANGNNAGVDFSTNSFIKLAAGPTAAFAICGIAGGADGRELIIYNSIAQNMTIANESGVEATAANRIVTMTGADVVSTGVGSAHLIYDSNASRWLLLYLTP